MIMDHIIGKPSPALQRTHVLLVLSACLYILNKNPTSKTSFSSKINDLLASSQPWKIIFGSFTTAYAIKNLFLLTFLNSPEPMSTMYTRSFYRATWILTGLDAGFLTAMHVKPDFLRHLLSVIFTVFYLIYPDKADEKVRRYRAVATIHMMRVSWEKSRNPILRLITYYDRGWLKIRRNITFKRPKDFATSFPIESVSKDINARIYFSGSKEELLQCNTLIFHIPGGGFVTMTPENHDDYLSDWVRQTGIPLISINYGKAPEHPYPFAIEECFDAYTSIVQSNGKCIGLQGWKNPDGTKKDAIRIVVCGDSAGGNLAASLILRLVDPQYVDSSNPIPIPCGLLLLYPCLTMDMACWMKPESLDLMRSESSKSLAKLLQAKEFAVTEVEDSPLTLPSAPKKINILHNRVDNSGGKTAVIENLFWSKSKGKNRSKSSLNIHQQFQQQNASTSQRTDHNLANSLSMTSRMSYFQDRVLQPEMMRAMALLYLNTSPLQINVHEDIYLSPLQAPREMLAKFPTTFFLTGEKDPLVDDTVIFASKLRQAKAWKREVERKKFGGTSWGKVDDNVRVRILEGWSHAFFNMMSFLPEVKEATQLTSQWFLELTRPNTPMNSPVLDSFSFGFEEPVSLDESGVGVRFKVGGGELNESGINGGSESVVQKKEDEQQGASQLFVKEKNLLERRGHSLAKQHSVVDQNHPW